VLVHLSHPYLWLDAKVVKVRDRGHVYPKALVIGYSVHESGRREVIGLDIGEIGPRRSGSRFCARCASAASLGCGCACLTGTSA
jgi:transposase-like protein